MRKLAINSNAVPGMDIHDFAKTVKALGFTHILSDTSTPAAMKEKAEALLPGINEVMDSWDALLVAGLTPQQQQLLAQLMSQMRTSITNTIEEG